MSFDKTIQTIKKQKFNVNEIFDRHKMLLKRKARMNIPLCRMISMFIVYPTLKINVLKMEEAFQTRYYERDKVFYISPLNWKGEEEFVDSNVDFWNAHWHPGNEKFEHLLLGDHDLKFLLR
jgi:hypothetical protein